MNDHVAKPIDVPNLFRVIERWLPKREGPLDLEGALQRLGGDRPLLERLLERFAQTQAEAASKLGEAFTAGESDAARRGVHTLKGLAGAIGARDLELACGAVERGLRDSGASRSMGASVVKELDRVLRFLGDHPAGTLAAAEALDETLQAAAPEEHKASSAEELLERLKDQLRKDDVAAKATCATLLSTISPSELTTDGTVEPRPGAAAWATNVAAAAEAIDSYDFADALRILEA